MTVGLASLARLVDDPGPCPVCDDYGCTHQFYGDEHYRIGDSKAKRRRKLAERHAAANPVEAAPPRRTSKGRRAAKRTEDRARKLTEDRAHHPDADRAPATTPAGEVSTCSSPPPTTGS